MTVPPWQLKTTSLSILWVLCDPNFPAPPFSPLQLHILAGTIKTLLDYPGLLLGGVSGPWDLHLQTPISVLHTYPKPSSDRTSGTKGSWERTDKLQAALSSVPTPQLLSPPTPSSPWR